MTNVELIGKINKYQDLLKAFSVRDGCEEQILLILHKLGKLDVNIDLLKETGVGKAVNGLRVKGGTIATVSNELVSKWKSLINMALDDKRPEEVERFIKPFGKPKSDKSKSSESRKPVNDSKVSSNSIDEGGIPANKHKRKHTSIHEPTGGEKLLKISKKSEEKNEICESSSSKRQKIPEKAVKKSDESGSKSSDTNSKVNETDKESANKIKEKVKLNTDKKSNSSSIPLTPKTAPAKEGKNSKNAPPHENSSNQYKPVEKNTTSKLKNSSNKLEKQSPKPSDGPPNSKSKNGESSTSGKSGPSDKKLKPRNNDTNDDIYGKKSRKRKHIDTDDVDDNDDDDDENDGDDDDGDDGGNSTNQNQSFLDLCNYDHKKTAGKKSKKSKTTNNTPITSTPKITPSITKPHPAAATTTITTSSHSSGFNSSSNNNDIDNELEINRYLKNLSNESDGVLNYLQAGGTNSPSFGEGSNSTMVLESHERDLGLRSNNRSAIFCGKRTVPIHTSVPTLRQACQRVLYEYIDVVEHVGMTPYELMEPVLRKCTADQLENFEFHNPQMIIETDDLWKIHCKKHCPNRKPDEMETWRELYMDSREEMKAKLEKCVVSIGAISAKVKNEVNKTKFIDACIVPAKRRGGWGATHVIGGSEKAPVANGNTHFFGGRPKSGGPVSGKGPQKPMGHLMKKTLQMMGRKR